MLKQFNVKNTSCPKKNRTRVFYLNGKMGAFFSGHDVPRHCCTVSGCNQVLYLSLGYFLMRWYPLQPRLLKILVISKSFVFEKHNILQSELNINILNLRKIENIRINVQFVGLVRNKGVSSHRTPLLTGTLHAVSILPEIAMSQVHLRRVWWKSRFLWSYKTYNNFK